MSAPDTNISKQEKQHRPALSGMALGVAVVAVLLFGFIYWTISNGTDEGTPAVGMDATTSMPMSTESEAPATMEGGAAATGGMEQAPAAD
jgi:hypothetical protein